VNWRGLQALVVRRVTVSPEHTSACFGADRILWPWTQSIGG